VSIDAELFAVLSLPPSLDEFVDEEADDVPEEPEFEDDAPFTCRCPACGHEWSGEGCR